MEQVLDFAVHELTKIVEASFDDLLLEITKMEREQQDLGETLDREAGGDKGRGGAGGRRRGSENDSVSPSGSEDTREELSELSGSKEAPRRDGGRSLTVMSQLCSTSTHDTNSGFPSPSAPLPPPSLPPSPVPFSPPSSPSPLFPPFPHLFSLSL